MFLALLLTLVVTVSGAVVTYYYDNDAPFPVRLCMGAVTGLAAWGLVGFVLASFIGLTPVTVGAATLLLAAPLALGRWGALTNDARAAWQRLGRAVQHPTRRTVVYGAFYGFMALLLWWVFDRTMIVMPNGGIGTGVQNNLGDLPFHLSVITGFAHGQNFPPADPTYGGIKFTYPFLTDFVSAMYVVIGADLRASLWVENYVLALALVGLLHHWTLRLTQDRIAGLIAPLLVLFSGGLGWTELLKQAKDSDKGLFGLLAELPQKYTIGLENAPLYRWGNAMTTLLVPQRGLLMGLPLALIVFAVIWKLTETKEAKAQSEFETQRREDAGTQSEDVKNTGKAKKKKKPQVTTPSPLHPFASSPFHPFATAAGAGVVTALLPLVHAHTYVVVMAVSGLIAVLSLLPMLFRPAVSDPEFHHSSLIIHHLKVWAVFFVVAVLIALPQMLWATHGSAVQASRFYAYKVGWDKPEDVGLVWFWFKNTGLFIPVTLAALVWRRGEDFLLSRRLLYFFLPFTLCFIAPNLFQMSPWIWDNIKVLFYWWVGSVPAIALLLAYLWRNSGVWRAVSCGLLAVLIAAGALDVWGIVNGKTEMGIFEPDNMEMAEIIKQKTAPRAVVLHAPTYSTPVFLSGRPSPMGYPGHVWSHGIDPAQRESDINRIYSGLPAAASLLANYGVQYVVVGPQERGLTGFNEAFWAAYPLVGQAGTYKLYQIK